MVQTPGMYEACMVSGAYVLVSHLEDKQYINKAVSSLKCPVQVLVIF